MSRSTTYRNKKVQILEHERHVYSKFLTNTLDAILANNIEHKDNCPMKENNNVFSVIMPLMDTTMVRISIGSHKIARSNGCLQYHSESVIDVHVPATYALIFNHNSTVHGGGQSSTKNTRIFAVIGEAEYRITLEGSNTIQGIQSCIDNCSTCSILKRIKESNNGQFLPFLEGSPRKKKRGELLNDYTLSQHGFCILRVSNDTDLSSTVQNQTLFLEDKKGIHYQSIGQETIDNRGGKRQMLSNSTELNADILLEKKLFGKLSMYIQESLETICNFLSSIYRKEFKLKGKTILQNKGEIGYQKLHTDGRVECKCYTE